jgi:hypothetical protein
MTFSANAKFSVNASFVANESSANYVYSSIYHYEWNAYNVWVDEYSGKVSIYRYLLKNIFINI